MSDTGARRPVDLPVRRVTCMEDRAQVEREGAIDTVAGVTRVRVEGISVVAVGRSLSASAEGARLLDAKLVRSWRERPQGGLAPEASDLERRIHALGRELEAIRDEQLRASAGRDVSSQARSDLWRAIAEQTGAGEVSLETWREQSRMSAESEARLAEAQRQIARREAQARQRLDEARAALAATQQPKHDLTCALELTLEGDAAVVTVRVRYLVPCAVWRPAYRATLGESTVLVESEAVVWQSTGEAWPDVALVFSTQRPTLGTRPPALAEDHLRTRPKQEREKRAVDVAVREEAIATTGEGGGTRLSELPGLDDGGVGTLLRAPALATVPSDGQPHRVPLSRFEAPAASERVAAPELSPLVSLVARFENRGAHALLAGPVDLVRQSGFVGRGQLSFVGKGEIAALSFGTDDDLRIVRSVAENVEEARITGRRTTTRRIALHVSNAGERNTRLVVEERVPVSEVKEVEVQVLTKDCAPAPASVSKEGIARIELQLTPHSQQTRYFAWELQAAARVAGI